MPIDGCPPNAAHNGKKVEAFAGEFCAATYIGGRDSGYHGDEVPPSRSALREWVHLTRVLLIGQIPETVDFADPAIPAGFNAEKIHAGIAIGMEKLKERGWTADLCLIPPDKTAALVLEKQLTSANYDCVVIGGGIRLPPKSLRLLEVVINAVRKFAPSASIAFNTRPEDTAEAAARWSRSD